MISHINYVKNKQSLKPLEAPEKLNQTIKSREIFEVYNFTQKFISH